MARDDRWRPIDRPLDAAEAVERIP